MPEARESPPIADTQRKVRARSTLCAFREDHFLDSRGPVVALPLFLVERNRRRDAGR